MCLEVELVEIILMLNFKKVLHISSIPILSYTDIRAFFLFIKNEMNKSKLDRKEFKRQQELEKSFNDNKLSGGHIKK